MIYLYALTLLALGSWLPWWSYLALAFVWGGIFAKWQEGLALKSFTQIGGGAGVVFVMVAYYRDVQASGLISKRLAGLMSLPHELILFGALFVMAFLSAGIFAVVGFQLSKLYFAMRLKQAGPKTGGIH